MRRQILVFLAATVAVMIAVPALAQSPDDVSQDRINEIARGLYCPLCPGLTVDVCELQVCNDMKVVIAQKLAAGASEAEIRQYFYELYGPKVIGAPEKRGSGLIAWLLPGAFVLAAIGAGIWWLRRRDVEPMLSPTDDTPTPLDDEDAERLRQELQRLELE